MPRVLDKLTWQRDAGTGKSAIIRVRTLALVAESLVLGINGWEVLRYPHTPKDSDYVWLDTNTHVWTLPYRGSEPKPKGKVCVTLIADNNVYLVDESSLLYKER